MTKSKEFLVQLNDLIAPVTRAWIDVEIMTVTVGHERLGVDSDDELVVDVRLLLKKSRRTDAQG